MNRRGVRPTRAHRRGGIPVTPSRPCIRNCAQRRRHGGRAQAVIETAMVIPIMLFLITGFIGLMIQVEVQQQLETATKLAAESTFQAPRSAHQCRQRAPGPGCAPVTLALSGLPTRCRYAGETFEGTMAFAFGSSYAQGGSVFTANAAGTPGNPSVNSVLQFRRVNLCKVEGGPNAGLFPTCGPTLAVANPPLGSNRCEPPHPDQLFVGPAPQRAPFPTPGSPAVNIYGQDNPVADVECDIDWRNPAVNNLRMTFCQSQVVVDFSKTPLSWAVFWKPTLTATAIAAPPPFRQ